MFLLKKLLKCIVLKCQNEKCSNMKTIKLSQTWVNHCQWWLLSPLVTKTTFWWILAAINGKTLTPCSSRHYGVLLTILGDIWRCIQTDIYSLLDFLFFFAASISSQIAISYYSCYTLTRNVNLALKTPIGLYKIKWR